MRYPLLALLPVVALASPFRPADLAADAQWFVHVDHDAARNSIVGTKVLGITDDRTCPVPEIRAFAEATGFDGRRDLVAFTAYGNGQMKRAVGVIRHSGDNLKVGEYLKSKGAEPEVIDGVPVLGFDCSRAGSKLLVAFPRAGVVVVSMNAADVAAACAALDNGAVVAEIPAEVTALMGNAPMVLIGTDMAACMAANPQARMPVPVRSGAMAITEAGGILSVTSALTFADAQAAQAAANMVEGMKAMASARRPDTAVWMETLAVAAQDNELAVRWSAKAEAITAEMDKGRARWQEMKAKRGGEAKCPITSK
jgi:hypothetical protein